MKEMNRSNELINKSRLQKEKERELEFSKNMKKKSSEMMKTPPKRLSMTEGSKGITPTSMQPMSSSGRLSELFVGISSVCEEQFSLIRKIFPGNAVAR